jgi:hypothetical protein
MYYRITIRECKIGVCVKELYFETEYQFADLKAILHNILNDKNDVMLCELSTILEQAAIIRSAPIIKKIKEDKTEIETALKQLRQIYNQDFE